MQKPGLLNKLRSYIWRESREQEPNVRIGLDDSGKNKTIEEQNTSMRNASLSGTLNGTLNGNLSLSNGNFESPNEELRSFFEANGDRELSKIEVLGVLNLISQAVVRDESVLDLSSVSQSTLHSANSSAFPPNLSNSFSTSNIGDLTSGSRSRRSTRRPLASGPKRHSAKTIVRSQSGISLRKPTAPVETQSRRRMKPSSSLRDVREYSQPMTGTANDILNLLDYQTNTPTTPGKGLRKRPVIASTPKASVRSAETPARSVPPQASSTPAFTTTPLSSAHSAIAKPSQNQSQTSDFQNSDGTSSLFVQQQPKQAFTPKPASETPANPPQHQVEQQESVAPITSMFTPPTLPEVDVDVEMDFEFPDPQPMPVNAADLQNSEKYAQEFVF